MADHETKNAVVWMLGATHVLAQKREALALQAITECGITLQPGERASDVLNRLDAMPEHMLRALLRANGKLR